MTDPPAPDGLSGQLEDRVRELEAVAQIAASFTFEQPLESMMTEVARQVVGSNEDAMACFVAVGNRETQLVERVLGSWAIPPGFVAVVEKAWRTSGTPLVSSSIQLRKTQVFALDTVLQRPGYEEVRAEQARAGWKRMAVVPMVYHEEALGLVFVFYPLRHEPDVAELRFLEAIANQAAVAVENAHLFELARANAVAEERLRMSRELHDSISQALYAISLSAKVAHRHLPGSPERAVEPVAHIMALADSSLSEMRSMIFDLRPEVLATEGVVAALARHAQTLRARHLIAIETPGGPEPEIPLPAKDALYRIAQEAINNALKHAQPSRIQVTFEQAGGSLIARIRDDGRGFELAADYPGHLGLTSMRERAARVHGTLVIESAPGAGCTVIVSIPA
jgi:signal transduction histidine kinase